MLESNGDILAVKLAVDSVNVANDASVVHWYTGVVDVADEATCITE